MVNYAVPTEPGRARLLHQVTLRKAMLPRVARVILSFRPAWAVAKQHMGASATLDGDSVFLKHQVRHHATPSEALLKYMDFTVIIIRSCARGPACLASLFSSAEGGTTLLHHPFGDIMHP